ncbi:MAG: hypothetical protein Kow0045_00770 [Albidovulum sp.]
MKFKMGILRLLFRAFTTGRRARGVAVRRRSEVIESRGPSATDPCDRQTIGIAVLEVTELRGRAWVIDGDTIDIGGTRIRLAGIDAPELDHPFGNRAKWTLVNLCRGQQVRAVLQVDLSHGRAVATCYLPDGRDLSAEMVRAGMAIDWPRFSGGKYSALEPAGIRRKLWRCDARQKGRMPRSLPD